VKYQINKEFSLAPLAEEDWAEEDGFDVMGKLEALPAEDRYADLELIGEGAVKEVYYCYDQRTKQGVALAKTKEGLDARFDHQLIYEAWITSTLNHPNIIKIYDVYMGGDGRPYFVMGLMNNYSLSDQIKEGGGRDRLLSIYLKVCDAMEHAHSRGVMHLDLKPQNIQCGEHGEVIVCDWGLAKKREGDSEEIECSSHLYEVGEYTLHGEVKGTPGYLAPEQLTGGVEKDFRADVYAMGCILYQILTGQMVYEGTAQEILEQTKTGRIVPPRRRAPECQIPKRLEAVVMKAVAHNPEERYASVAELAQEIKRYRAGYAVEAERANMLSRVHLFCLRHQSVTVSILAAGLLLSLVTGIYLGSYKQKEVQVEGLVNENGELSSDLKEAQDGQQRLAEENLYIKNILPAVATKKKRRGSQNLYAEDLAHDIEADVMVLNSMLRITPKHQDVSKRLIVLHSLRMNFRAACQIAELSGLALEDFQFIWHFREMEGKPERRPSMDEMVAFFEKARELQSEKGLIVPHWVAIGMVQYDQCTRRKFSGYNKVVVAVLNYVNANEPGYKLVHNEDYSEISIYGGSKLKLHSHRLSSDALLGYLNTRRLTLVLPEVTVSALKDAQIKELDISLCDQVHYDTPVIIQRLQELRLNVKESQKRARYYILSQQPYRITQVDEGTQ